MIDATPLSCEFANAVYKEFQKRRYGLDSCKQTEELTKLKIRKELSDWNQTDPSAQLCCNLES
jgi:hypothetical protein